MSFYQYFWHLKTAILGTGTWKSLKKCPWILSFQFAMNPDYMTASAFTAATWDPRYCQAVCPWSDVRSDRWYSCSHARLLRPHKWRGPSTCTWVVHMIHSTPGTWVVHCRVWQRQPQSNYMDDHSLWVPGNFFRELTTLVWNEYWNNPQAANLARRQPW